MKKDPVRFESLEKKRDFFEATTPRPPASLPLERNATFSRKKKKRGRLRRFPFCAHRRRHIIFKQRYKTAISLEEERAQEKGRRFEDQTTDEKNSKKERHRRRRHNERRRERSRAHQRGGGIIIYRVFMSGSLTFFFPILTLVGTPPPLFFTVCFENVGPRPGARAGVARTRAGVFRATV